MPEFVVFVFSKILIRYISDAELQNGEWIFFMIGRTGDKSDTSSESLVFLK